MKFRKPLYRTNESMNYDSLLLHIKHIKEYKNDPRLKDVASGVEDAVKRFGIYYNAIADDLANMKAGKSDSDTDNIVGFVNKENYYVKYNKGTGDYVVYNPRSSNLKTYTLHKKTFTQYLNNLNRDFKSELPENKDNKNNEI